MVKKANIVNDAPKKSIKLHNLDKQKLENRLAMLWKEAEKQKSPSPIRSPKPNLKLIDWSNKEFSYKRKPEVRYEEYDWHINIVNQVEIESSLSEYDSVSNEFISPDQLSEYLHSASSGSSGPHEETHRSSNIYTNTPSSFRKHGKIVNLDDEELVMMKESDSIVIS